MKKSGNVNKKLAVLAFLLLIFLPAALGGFGSFVNKNFDVELNGFTDVPTVPKLMSSSFYSGNYQKEYGTWFDSNLKPRGVLTKIYATIQYDLFDTGNRIVGKNKDIFESSYIESELAIGEKFDMSLEQSSNQIKEYVEKLELLQEKLAEHGKYLYVYTPANKADLHIQNVPECYKAMHSDTSLGPQNYFRELIEKTTIPYLHTADIGRELEYPAFYTTGIHWSRPFEQTVSQRILLDLCEMTGKNYRKLDYGEVNTSESPFWRDSDVFDLLNVWNDSEETYYEFSVNRDIPERFDRLEVLFSGTSFGLGFRKDVLDAHPAENIFYVNRDEYYMGSNGIAHPLNGEWSNLDLKKYLDMADVVIVESIAPELIYGSYGFIENLLAVLAEYTPSAERTAITSFDGSNNTPIDWDCVSGFWDKEEGFAWVNKEAAIEIKDSVIAESGLQMDFSVPDPIIENEGTQEVHIYVNGKKVFFRSYNTPTNESVLIPSETLAALQNESGVYEITIMCSGSIIPFEIGMNNDTRELAAQITYIGRAK